MIAGNHIYISHGCAKCGHEEANIKKTLTQEEFINKAIIVHGSTFDYSQTVYKSAQKKVIICCKEHGPFEQKAASHLDGCGCPYCMGVIRTTARFIEKALLIHGTKYSYDKSNYINSKSKIIITCPDHGDFKVVASEFLRGGGCRGCMTSHPETTWLNSLNVPVRQHKVQFDGHYIVVDGYDPVTNTCYEFHGDFWHGNPALYSPNEINKISKISFGELYERTKKREQLITESGYNLVVMWEDEWNKINK